MPSALKTPNMGLSNWQPNDKPTWPDIAADMLRVDAQVGNLANLTTTAKTNLVAAISEASLSTKGDTGDDGREIELQQGVTHIQWRYVGDADWQDLISIAALLGPIGPTGPANSLSIGTVSGGDSASAEITGEAPTQVLNLILPKGDASTVPGPSGRGIVSIVRTSGTGAPGTTDTYTITYSDETTSTISVYNGADGSGSGDMSKSVYDPGGKAADAFSMANMVEGATQKIMTADERAKLTGIAENANNYTHPANHPPSIITQDASNRFVTDAEKTTWNGKQGALGFTAVPDTRKVNGKALSADVTLTANDVGAVASPSSLTALPASGTALTNNTEYRVSAAVGTYVFAWPDSPFECWLRFTTDATFSITFPSGTVYIGGAPTFKASTQYEMSIKDGVVIVQEVAAA